MHEAIDIPGGKYKACTELERIFAQLVLAVAGGVRAFAGNCILAAQQVQERSFAKSRGAIRFPLRIDEQRKRDAGLLAKNARVVLVTQPYGCEIRASSSEFRLVLAQLRDVLAAEHSAIMPQKYHHRRTIRPQRAEANKPIVSIGELDISQSTAETFSYWIWHCLPARAAWPSEPHAGNM
jgi:hypothetical protein